MFFHIFPYFSICHIFPYVSHEWIGMDDTQWFRGDLVDFEGRQYSVTALHEDRASIPTPRLGHG